MIKNIRTKVAFALLVCLINIASIFNFKKSMPDYEFILDVLLYANLMAFSLGLFILIYVYIKKIP